VVIIFTDIGTHDQKCLEATDLDNSEKRILHDGSSSIPAHHTRIIIHHILMLQ
jgi:hypothetical protein